jgi:NADH-quinone oxidoreductase subunit E
MSAAPSIDPKRIQRVLARYPEGDASLLVNLLHDLQAELRYLPEMALRAASDHLGIPEARVFGVATFYEGFHMEPRGEHVCTVCMGTACHVRGAPRLLEEAERDLGIRSGKTTKDLEFTLEHVNCVGACALGPLVIIDDQYHGHMTPDRLSRKIRKLRKSGRKAGGETKSKRSAKKKTRKAKKEGAEKGSPNKSAPAKAAKKKPARKAAKKKAAKPSTKKKSTRKKAAKKKPTKSSASKKSAGKKSANKKSTGKKSANKRSANKKSIKRGSSKSRASKKRSTKGK